MFKWWRLTLAPLMLGLVVAVPPGVFADGQTASTAPPAVPAAALCRISGHVTSNGVPLPGVSINAGSERTTQPQRTSSDIDGTYSLLLPGVGSYHVSADFSGFVGASQDIVVTTGPDCARTLDFQLPLSPRGGMTNASAEAPARAPASQTDRPNRPPDATASNPAPARRFERLNVAPSQPGEAATESTPNDSEVAALLPPGFSVDSAQAEPIAFAARGNAAALDRGMMNERTRLIDLGQLDPSTGQVAQAFGPGAGAPGQGNFGGPGDGLGGPGGRGGGPFGGQGFFLGGRGMRGQRPYQGSATYTFGGSALNTPPFQLNPHVPVTQPPYTQNTFGGTFGGPVKIPHLYDDANRRTTFQINYTGNRSNNVFDQYATVPTVAERAGDFSALTTPLLNPNTGQPFAGNRIPASSIDPGASSLLSFIPAPNLPGETRNYHAVAVAQSSSEAVSLRLLQNLSRSVSPPPAAPGGRAGPGNGSRRAAFGAASGTNVMLSVQLQYRHTDVQALNVFPNLGSDTTATNLSIPVSLNVRRGRSIQNFTVNVTHATSETGNAFANVVDVAGLAGIQYPTSEFNSPQNWGVPDLSFSSGLTGVQLAPANARVDDRLSVGYTWMHPSPKHRLRAGADYRFDRSDATINSNARGTFIYTGLYTSGGAVAQGGADFADFLLGHPQQASLQVGDTSRLRQHSMDAYVEDNWQRSAKLTLNLGLRYELALPYTEVNGRLANLAATPDFSTVTPVTAGTAAPNGEIVPAGLLNADANNLGPRLGIAYRVGSNTTLRGSYSITYNSGTYAPIAHQLAAQPPFADTETVTGTEQAPLTMAEALLAAPADTSGNNWGVDRDYLLGTIQTWNANVLRNITPNWFAQAGYTAIRGSNLDFLRAPYLGAGGIVIPGTQPFIWESSGGRSRMNGGTFQVRRRLANGYSGGVSYTLARATDDVPSLGAGSPVVAQNDQDLGAEWGSSNFDRRHQVAGDVYVELPWGPNRRWLRDGGWLAGIFGDWSAQFTLTLQSGTPLTARVLGAASDVLRGVNGSLRANATGEPIQLTDPTVDEFFNVAAFAAPAAGEYGDSPRNAIVGPGIRQLNALLQRDVHLGGARALTVQVRALNLLNTVQWAAVDTNVNSATFGQVLSARPMRTVTLTARLRF